MNGNPIEPPSGSEDFSHAFQVPDDARELDRDAEAWRREERWRRRRERLQRLAFWSIPLPRRWREQRGQQGRPGKRGVAVPVIALIVVAVGLFSATATLITTRAASPARPPVPLKLAAPAAAAGTTGGLLPDATLTTDTGATSARDLRPGVVGIVTPGAKLSALTGNRALFKDGMPMALLSGGKVEYTASIAPAEQWEAKKKLLRSAAPRHFADFA